MPGWPEMAAVADVTEVLTGAQSPDANTRNQAELQLKQFQQQNLPSYLLSLATEIANDAKPEHSRQMAGLMLKNALDAPSAAVKVSPASVISCTSRARAGQTACNS